LIYSSLTYFCTSSRSPSFDIDVVRLEQRYKDMQREFHPDKFATASALEREYSAYYASLINEGYSMLRHPLHRARLLVTSLSPLPHHSSPIFLSLSPSESFAFNLKMGLNCRAF
jgi:DnaJ-domain-containing protein 1